MEHPETVPKTFDDRKNSIGPDVPLHSITRGSEKFMIDQSKKFSKKDGNVR